MAGEVTVTEVSGIGKKVYDRTMRKALPASAILQKRIGWDKGTRAIGESYNVSVVLRPPNGFTYAGTAGGVTTLKAPRNMVIKQASIIPFEMELREQFAWAALSRAAKEGEGSFAQLAGTGMWAMKESSSNRLEMAALDGQRPLGEVEAVTDLGGGLADLTITQATWAPGRWWAIGQKATMDSFTSTTKNNGSGPLITEGLNIADRKVKVSYTGTLGSEVAAGDVLYFEGAWDGTTYNEMPGLIAQARNTTGTSLGLSATTYPNWAGNLYDVAGNISYEVLEDMCSLLRDRGASGTLTAYFSNLALSKLVGELKLLRVIDSSYNPSKGKVGYKAVSFETPEFGEVEIVGHPFMKQSECLIQDEGDIGRVGSSDIDFGLPGVGEDRAPMFERVSGSTAAELILFTDQCVINKEPRKALHGYGITFT